MKQSTPSEIFPKRLYDAREIRGLTQAELAKASGLQPSAISHFEAGTRKPSFDNLRRLANALEVPTDYLIGRTDELEAVGRTSDSVFRDLSRLTTTDQELARDFISRLAQRSKSGTKKKER